MVGCEHIGDLVCNSFLHTVARVNHSGAVVIMLDYQAKRCWFDVGHGGHVLIKV